MKKYSLILADCPWKYDNQQQNDPNRGGITYPVLTMEELQNLPMHRCATDDSILVFWVTFPKLIDQFYATKEKVGGKSGNRANPISIIHAWGFRPVTALFVWVKLNRNAKLQTLYMSSTTPSIAWTPVEYTSLGMNDLYSGLGRYTNSNAEIALVCRRGKGLPRVNKNVKQLIFAPIGEHSAKPQEQYKRLHDLYGDVPRIELFARKQNAAPEGWEMTGLDYDGVDIRDFLKGYEE